MTDNEIIKALEKCTCESGTCEGCVYADDGCLMEDGTNKLTRDALNLINRQQAEIEEYKKVNILIAQQRDGRDKDIADLEAAIETLETNNHSLCMTLANRARVERVEAIKEFAERLKEEFKPDPNYEKAVNFTIKLFRNFIDNLVKEMVGE